ncbi:MAG: hypothetical protein A3B91_04950 [Candidatus Yanofskybacteria bacterium RIFCSPHIGHO2_02_FULL_41_29]|uniref:Uncharacterized protein n=1 Tax=Candidatus Yanofskybacteria bacterium RIFCSPHIGHO2_01_FULL_41_53 TaxID=1802663 RepID=A0A1F8EGK1_9BACT|nr:MAG: hypothetical protein A2650_01560 [Candidatus Yanofskybacteria bacterium RIFCSPHIGHO2_01_FULL_41_53]OGN11167.1 MAG: hypothetical protein A3B91_04950 [Candidatus Yanofskybacteria bacterium RIFCSPHIGHO2_02_FULL_41_29]OGN16833.1 MAG: hypothetical protein A3F48_04250 [Candidatus Yanofskybacteria bacterium RIFCSPHIGHO2_12_FULL_41_9]OGN22081.1 MAG: hypothetical protein A2916_00170 [Candidatus Yanofskybacteria bacterium RIFCSPLOWO2_01_FULL_41_67]OGN34579.1 MAG: hypothetical protein A3F98_02240 
MVLLVFITILAGTSMAMISFSFDPYKTTDGIKMLFFLSLFAFMWGAGTIAFFILNIANSDRWNDSFRRGLLLSVLFVILIFFKRHDVLSWYLGSIFGGLFTVFEIWMYKRISKRNNVLSE